MSLSIITSENIVEIYNSSNKQRPNPSSYDLFILVNGSSIFTKLKGNSKIRPDLKDRRLALRSAWDHLEFNQKTIYTEASLKLGYVPRLQSTFKADRVLTLTAAKRLESINNRRLLTK